MKRLITILLFCSFFVFPLSLNADDYKDGMKAYKKGNMTEALEFFLGQVINKPKHQKSVNMIKEVLPQVIKYRKSKAKKYEEAERWDKAEKEYKRLEKLNNILQNLRVYDNDQLVVWPIIDVAGDRTAATSIATENAYQKGVEAMQTPGNAEQAIEFFKKARKYDPDYKNAKELSGQALYNDGMALVNEGDYKGAVRILWKLRDFFPEGFKDSEQQIEAAIDSGKTKVAVMPFDDLTFRSRYGDIGLAMSSEIVAAGVTSNPIFVDFVTRDFVYSLLSEQDFGESDRIDASTAAKIGKLIGVDVFVFGRITAVTPNYPGVTTTRGRSSKLIYQGKLRKQIYASWTKYSRVGKVTVSASYQIVDVNTGRVVDSKSFRKTASSFAQWVKYTGEEAALENSVLAHTTTGDVSVDPSEILAERAVRMVSKNIAANILVNYEE